MSAPKTENPNKQRKSDCHSTPPSSHCFTSPIPSIRLSLLLPSIVVLITTLASSLYHRSTAHRFTPHLSRRPGATVFRPVAFLLLIAASRFFGHFLPPLLVRATPVPQDPCFQRSSCLGGCPHDLKKTKQTSHLLLS